MSLRRASFEIVTDTNGQGSDDIHLRPGVGTRHARLTTVTLDRVDIDDGSDTAFGFSWPTITISELLDVSNATLWPWNDTTEDYQLDRQLFFVDTSKPNLTGNSVVGDTQEWDPRYPAITVFGETPVYEVLVGSELIRNDDVRCEVNSGGSGETWRLTMYYETAGDYRF